MWVSLKHLVCPDLWRLASPSRVPDPLRAQYTVSTTAIAMLPGCFGRVCVSVFGHGRLLPLLNLVLRCPIVVLDHQGALGPFLYTPLDPAVAKGASVFLAFPSRPVDSGHFVSWASGVRKACSQLQCLAIGFQGLGCHPQRAHDEMLHADNISLQACNMYGSNTRQRGHSCLCKASVTARSARR